MVGSQPLTYLELPGGIAGPHTKSVWFQKIWERGQKICLSNKITDATAGADHTLKMTGVVVHGSWHIKVEDLLKPTVTDFGKVTRFKNSGC